MGLDIYISKEGTEVWHGAYSAFMRFRVYIAQMIGMHLRSMWGFADIRNSKYICPHYLEHEDFINNRCYMEEEYKPIPFPPKEEEPLVVLLSHSDCDGRIKWFDCKGIADRLTQLYDRMNNEDLGGHIGNIKEKTKIFINGCYKAVELQKDLVFR